MSAINHDEGVEAPLPTSTGLEDSMRSRKCATRGKPTTCLLLWDQLPIWQQDNRHIFGGYRPASDSHYKSIHSLTYLHNETVNIYTHLIGMIATAVLCFVAFSIGRSRYSKSDYSDLLAVGTFFTSVILCLGTSALYHTLSNPSLKVNDICNKLDLLGIVLLIWGSMVSIIYYGRYCERNIKIAYCTMITVFGASCAYLTLSPKVRAPKWRAFRALMFVLLGLSAILPVVHGVFLYGMTVVNTRIVFVPWLLTEALMYILGAVVYAVRFPESSFPGNFDIWGSSHQIFHVLVVPGAAAHLVALVHSFDYNHTSGRC
ncbi:related to adiponectin receptor protein 1 [Rhynchosporium secalis]|uniref:Related to adiponectin receptor protein 1 n=1 Tax=Rhynchosporium secalis TaxID=38038 RepID=A0A1E1MVE8_RHYSE|nr:related to adiponectin receptor protein 1 [Rhynchosporium secalis]